MCQHVCVCECGRVGECGCVFLPDLSHTCQATSPTSASVLVTFQDGPTEYDTGCKSGQRLLQWPKVSGGEPHLFHCRLRISYSLS